MKMFLLLAIVNSGALILGHHGADPLLGPGVTLAAVVFPLERLEITKIVRAALGDRLDVVNLPSVAETVGLAVGGPVDPSAAAILAPDAGVHAVNRLCL